MRYYSTLLSRWGRLGRLRAGCKPMWGRTLRRQRRTLAEHWQSYDKATIMRIVKIVSSFVIRNPEKAMSHTRWTLATSRIEHWFWALLSRTPRSSSVSLDCCCHHQSIAITWYCTYRAILASSNQWSAKSWTRRTNEPTLGLPDDSQSELPDDNFHLTISK